MQVAAQLPGAAAAGLPMSPAISPAALEGSAALNQEAVGTKGPLRVQRGVAAAPCLIPAYLLSASFIVPLGFSFYCFSQHRSGNQTQRFAAGSKVPEQRRGGALTGKVLGTSLPPRLGGARWSIVAPETCPAWQGLLWLAHSAGHGASSTLSPPDSSFDPDLPIS